MKTIMLTLIIILILPSLVMAANPIAKLLFESAIETDRQMSYQWHHSSKNNMIISPNGYEVYEKNIFVAGSTKEEFDKIINDTKLVVNNIDKIIENEKMAEILYWSITLYELYNTLRLIKKSRDYRIYAILDNSIQLAILTAPKGAFLLQRRVIIMGTPYDKNNPLHALIIGPNGPIPQKYDPEANSGQGGMVPSTVDDVQKVTQIGSIVASDSEIYSNRIFQEIPAGTIQEILPANDKYTIIDRIEFQTGYSDPSKARILLELKQSNGSYQGYAYYLGSFPNLTAMSMMSTFEILRETDPGIIVGSTREIIAPFGFRLSFENMSTTEAFTIRTAYTYRELM